MSSQEPVEAASPAPHARRPLRRRLRTLLLRAFALVTLVVGSCAMINPPTTWTIMTEGSAGRHWTPLRAIAPVMARSVVAAEDANFCRHWGFDMSEIRRVIASGSNRGASTISQQVTKNVFLWQGRSWPRKAMEAGLTPLVEALWSKRRILEVYLNVAEFGPGIFGIAQAAERHFATTPDKLTSAQAARLAAILPAPKERDPTGPAVARRAAAIIDGAATIQRDGRAACFQDPVPAAAGG
ncbi:monofunctional biosynthetic peptidoglycan transglycosylase [Paracoccus suum]|uniref:Biosynthetic peptidoglycan transglycosylase n=1 Tax=Paracoccus suum TaxID=2259340 RepID=A0A344PNR9_9RHOB|nr:biosynthetic peptidoglycan transglycosylase [Paracoccus suum]AXC51024.1 monofunctional biosynthetic peptidoglycan transglycosylase [Paracoccus suum]